MTSKEQPIPENPRMRREEEMSRVFAEILPEVRSLSVTMILDFSELPVDVPDHQNIQRFFEIAQSQGENPRLPENRQRFNDRFLSESGALYLIGRYAENRISMLQGSKIAAEGRTYHLGIDIFTQDLAKLYAPYQGRVVRVGQEAGKHTYGYYVILEHRFDQDTLYSFYGHLNSNLPELGSQIETGQPFIQLGDYLNDENGGWSRHVHFQLLRELPIDDQPPIGYSTLENLPENLEKFPDPNFMLQLHE